jgi:hypothetical protein
VKETWKWVVHRGSKKLVTESGRAVIECRPATAHRPASVFVRKEDEDNLARVPEMVALLRELSESSELPLAVLDRIDELLRLVDR